jgi:hypothetical protein
VRADGLRDSLRGRDVLDADVGVLGHGRAVERNDVDALELDAGVSPPGSSSSVPLVMDRSATSLRRR